MSLEAVAEQIGRVDIIICSTGSDKPVLTKATLGKAIKTRATPLVIIDLGVPRNAEESLAQLANVRLYNIDDLDCVVARAMAGRLREIECAEAIVADEAQQFEQWRQARQVAPTVEQLRRHLSAIASAEVDRYGRKFDGANREELGRFAQSLMSKVLHRPTTFLMELAVRPDGIEPPAAADMVRQLFGLDGREDGQ